MNLIVHQKDRRVWYGGQIKVPRRRCHTRCHRGHRLGRGCCRGHGCCRAGEPSYDSLRSRVRLATLRWRIGENVAFRVKPPCSLSPNSGENLDRGMALALSWYHNVFSGEPLPLLEQTNGATLSLLAPMANARFKVARLDVVRASSSPSPA